MCERFHHFHYFIYRMEASDGYSSSPDSISSSEPDTFDYPCPKGITLPIFLNADWKWTHTVTKTDNLTKYKDLLQKIHDLPYQAYQKRQILIELTKNIVDAHRYLSPHWHLLYSSEIFN